ncbi:DUF4060 family protein [Hafnia alvei]|uniref:DUF4060 family protein n=1 Tax=Hafnia alvei TaxID=569 RepID=UPI00345C8848
MRHIIKGNPESTERAAIKAALNLHQAKYGDYGPTKKGVTYTIKVSEEKFFIEIINREKSYVVKWNTKSGHLNRGDIIAS